MKSLRIGIVENEGVFADLLKNLISVWEIEHKTLATIEVFLTPQKITQLNPKLFDLIFLDIGLEQNNGMDLAKKMRADGYEGELVFVTSFKEYVFEGYDVHALNYLIKPVQSAKLFPILDYASEKLNVNCYLFRNKKELVKIPYSDIILFTSNDHYILIQTASTQYQQYGSFGELSRSLPDNFIQCHRTAIVNLRHIEKLTKNELVLTHNIRLTISRTYLDPLRKALLNTIL